MTTRLLHLIDDAHPAAIAMLQSLVAAWPEAEHRVLVLGHSELQRELQAGGLVCEASLTWMGLLRAGAVARDRIVIAWSPRCARAASVMLSKTPCVWVVMKPADRLTLYLMRRVRGVAVCVNPTLRPCLEQGGLHVECVRPLFDARLLEEPVPRNDAPLQNNDKVIALLADDPRHADVLQAVLAINLVDTAMSDDPASPRWRLRVHPDALNQTRGRKYVDTAGSPHQLLLDPAMARPWRRLGVCDAAMLWGPDATVAAGWARAAGLAIIDATDADPPRAADQLRSFAALGSLAVRPEAAKPCNLSDWHRAIDVARVRT